MDGQQPQPLRRPRRPLPGGERELERGQRVGFRLARTVPRAGRKGGTAERALTARHLLGVFMRMG